MTDHIVKIDWHGKHAVTMAIRLNPELANEATIAEYIQIGQPYEAEVVHLMDRALRVGDLAVDVGANAGWHTVYMGHVVGEHGHVLAFEPGINTSERLAMNIAANGLFNVAIVERPAWHTGEEVTLWLNSDNSGGNALWDIGDMATNPKSFVRPRPVTMPATTIDEELKARGLGIPRLIKVDVEGAEHAALQGAEGLLRWHAVPYVVCELNAFLERLGSSQEALRGYMHRFGYETWVLYPDGALPKLVPDGCMLSSLCVTNLLFARVADVAALWPIEAVDHTAMARTKGEFRHGSV